MIQTKAESQDYLANPYNSLGPLHFDSNVYVIIAINFPSSIFFPYFSFRLPVSCHLSNAHERGVIQWLEATLRPRPLWAGLDRPLATIHQFALFPCFRLALIPANIIAD
jgi:hypothetical protein